MAETRTYGGYTYTRQPDGSWVRGASAQPQMPADPTFPYRGRQAEAQADNTGAQAQVNQATVPAQIRQAEAQATAAERSAQTAGLAEGQMWGPDGSTAVPIPGYTRQGLSPEVRQKAISQYQVAQQLDRLIAELGTRFEEGPGSTHGLAGLRDYLPTPANQRFDRTASGVRGIVRNALGLTGGEANTAAEAQMNLGAYVPDSSYYDETNEDTFQRLKDLRDMARTMSIQTLGGIPDENGVVTPIPEQSLPNAWTADRLISGAGNAGAAPAGATMGTRPIPPEMQAEFEQGFSTFMRNGRVDPNAYAAFRAGLDKKYGFPEVGMQYYIGDANRLNQGLAQPGASINVTIPEPARELSQGEQNRNNAVNNPVGAALAGFTDMVGFGGVSALAPEQMAALGESQPLGMGTGQVLGSIGGTAAIGKLGTATLGRAAPGLLRGGAGAQFGRNLATDAAYGGIYGGVTEGDPLTGAGLATLGSAGGQGIGKVLGRAVSGVTSSPTIARLRELGITPTIGQIARARAADNGGRSLVAGVEDTIANNGFLGTFVNNARGRTLEQADNAAFNIASHGQPITGTGEQALAQLDMVKDAAYDRALNGVSLPVDDPAFRAAFDSAGEYGQAVDTARGRGDFGFVINNRLSPALGGGPNINGQQLQDGLRLLQGQSRAYNKAAAGAAPDPAASSVADSFDLVGDALTDLAGNYYPDAIPQLRDANQIYRNLRVLDDAAERGRNEGGVFTGAQLGDAIGANNRQFGQRGFMGRGNSPLNQLQQDMVTALPNKVPPTGVNAAPMLALLGAASGAGGVATDNDYLKYGGLLSLAALPYTKAGQRVVAASLLDRGPRAEMIGRAIRKRAGLFGSAALPLALEAGM